MNEPTPFVHRNLPRLLLEAREAVMQHTRPSLREHGLSDQQWRVLRVLGEHAAERAGVETGRVAREALLLGPSLTGVLTRMERDGLIERRAHPRDKRAQQIFLTDKARDMREEALAAAEEAEQAVFQGFRRFEKELLKEYIRWAIANARKL